MDEEVIAYDDDEDQEGEDMQQASKRFKSDGFGESEKGLQDHQEEEEVVHEEDLPLIENPFA